MVGHVETPGVTEVPTSPFSNAERSMKILKVANSTLIALLLYLVTSQNSLADIIVSVDDARIQTTSRVQTTVVEVYLDLTGANDGGILDVGNFQVLVELKGPAVGTDVSIVGVAETTSLDHPQAAPLDLVRVLSDSRAQAFTVNINPSFNIEDLDGLMAAELEIQPFAEGEYELAVLTGIGRTEILDGSDFVSQLDYSTRSAALTLTAVPEPASLNAVVALIMYLGSRRRRKGQL